MFKKIKLKIYDGPLLPTRQTRYRFQKMNF